MSYKPLQLDEFARPSRSKTPLESGPFPDTDSSGPVEQNKIPKQSRRSSPRTLLWRMDILSWLASLCFFVAIVAILAVYNGKPLPDLPLGITLNAIVSLLGTFAQIFYMTPVASTLGQSKWLRSLERRPFNDFRMMDDASRGSWGSFKLLIRFKGGLVSSFAALFTILTLGASFFFQQVLRYEFQFPESDGALIQIARSMKGAGVAPTGFGSQGETIGNVDSELLPVPYVSLFSQANIIFVPEVRCDSGNCTWSSYQNLAVCNTCANITDKLTRSKVHIKSNKNEAAYDTNYYTLPNGFGLTGEYVGVPGFAHGDALMNITVFVPPEKGTIDSVAFAGNDSVWFSTIFVGPQPGMAISEPDGTGPDDAPLSGDGFASPLAYECMLSFCVKDMNATFQNASVVETTRAIWNNEQPFDNPLEDIEIRPPFTKDVFVIDGMAAWSTSQWIASLVTGNISNVHGDITNRMYSSPMMQAFFLAANGSSTGFSDVMENLANGLSQGLRTISYQPPAARGRAFTTTSHFVVHWAWLAFPLTLLIGSLVILVAVIVQTNRSTMAPWGNDVLAVLLHGLDEQTRQEMKALHDDDALHREARRLLVSYRDDETGGRLVGSRFP
ncbi:hypothetical protein BDV96DRAFT_650647 [Lophiotrema nucula]|uniref:Uncharacterized protein n=1 Tax=Lophiotrema nucula TaxID=690887 RepID=A0A6A5YV95_9PLEO|nr:hypothetical protein BDV96DRAFT_650647 [Lophiotrema nucula]